MADAKRNGVDTWDFGEILAALCEIARDAGGTEPGAAGAAHDALRHAVPALTPGEQQQ